MKYAKQLVCMTLLILAAGPLAYSAQLGSQPFVFYGEEPWGGSYLGVDTQDITPDRLAPLRLKEEKGVEVTMVDQDAPAGKAGIKEHDVILSINDQQVESVEQLRRLIREIPAGRTITIGISRDGQLLTLHAQLAERNKMPDMNFNFSGINPPVVRMPPINVPEIDVPTIMVIHAPRSSGMMIENLTPQLGEYFGVKGGNGVLVRSVEKGSRAEQSGIHAGDVIVKINGSAVNDCSDFSRLLRSRNTNKNSVTIVRDRKEQTLTLTLPEPRRTGSLEYEKCDRDLNCAELYREQAEIAALMPEFTADLRRIQPDLEKMKKQLQKEMERNRPEIEKMKKQIQEEILSHQGEWQKEAEKMREDMEKQKDQLKKELRELQKKSAEI